MVVVAAYWLLPLPNRAWVGGLSRKTSRASRMFNMTTKSNTPPKVPQPERLDEVYEALKKGLQ